MFPHSSLSPQPTVLAKIIYSYGVLRPRRVKCIPNFAGNSSPVTKTAEAFWFIINYGYGFGS